MVQALGRHPNICPYLHLPVQSGSDRILRLMGRGYRIQEYRDLVDRLRQARPDLALSTDIIVGFPGETKGDFMASLALVEELRFSALFAFVYSPRPGTPSLRLSQEIVPRDEADRRLQRLLSRQAELQLELNTHLVDTEMEVLVTGQGSDGERYAGRTPCHRIVHFPAPPESLPVVPGRLVSVLIERALPHSLVGRLAP
jgi:tRNA-2-methylthio-N6-dimethylallyladenosine synthase